MSSGGQNSCRDERRTVDRWLAAPLLGLIRLDQLTLSPMMGDRCRFYPSCSHYAQDALRKHGAWLGSIMSAKRVLRCHPWHEPGYDPVE